MKGKHIIVDCPHCKDKIFVFVKDFNCKIFRHGIYKKNFKQINPHATKEICDKLKEENLIYGCGKPFKLMIEDNNYYTEICDYI